MPQSVRNVRNVHEAFRLRLHNVTLQRGAKTVFSGLSLQLDEARIGLIGDNGSGKTSLFRLICGLDKPGSGDIAFGLEAQQPAGVPKTQLVGMMFQNPEDQIIFPTVEEELALSLLDPGLSRKAARAKAREFLAGRGLGDWAPRAIGALSQGQRQHVCWLALMLAGPRLILLDEPFASLDLPGQAMLCRDIAQASQSFIVSTHLLDHVRDFERVIWLDDGQVRADGVGRQVCAAYEADVALRVQRLGRSALDGAPSAEGPVANDPSRLAA